MSSKSTNVHACLDPKNLDFGPDLKKIRQYTEVSVSSETGQYIEVSVSSETLIFLETRN